MVHIFLCERFVLLPPNREETLVSNPPKKIESHSEPCLCCNNCTRRSGRVCGHNINKNSALSERGHEDHMDHICAESILLVCLRQSNLLSPQN